MEPKTSDAESLKDYKIASEAILLMNELQASAKPFFLAVGFNLPHVPYDVPKEFYDLYANADIRLPEDYKSLPGWKDVPEDAFRPNLDLFFEQSAWKSKARELIKAYYACVSFMDAQIGRLLNELERLGLSENTIVAVASDNGYHLGQKGLWAKMTLFEHSARVPLIITDPRKKQTAGSRCQAISELIDIYPTLVELCGMEVPPKLEGRSLVRFLNDPRATWDRAASTVLLRHGKLAKSIRTSQWRYTEWDEGRRGTELYDHLNDPHEMHNLANDREYAEIISMLKQRLRSGKF
jgi:iduronate 2-sulfatase